MFPGEQIITLLLQIVLEAMRGQSEAQRQEMWAFYIEDLKWWRKVLKIGEQP